jgi:hypothetical protein
MNEHYKSLLNAIKEQIPYLIISDDFFNAETSEGFGKTLEEELTDFIYSLNIEFQMDNLPSEVKTLFNSFLVSISYHPVTVKTYFNFFGFLIANALLYLNQKTNFLNG